MADSGDVGRALVRALSQILSDSTADRVAAEGATQGTYRVEPDGGIDGSVTVETTEEYPVVVADMVDDGPEEIADASNFARNASPTRVLQRAADIEGMADRIAALTADAERLAGALRGLWDATEPECEENDGEDRDGTDCCDRDYPAPRETWCDRCIAVGAMNAAISAHDAVKP